MRWKTTALLLVATVGIGAYISLHEIRQPDRQERERLAKRILTLRPDAVTQLVLDLPKAKVTLSRNGSRWQLNPSGARADETLISQLLNELSPLTAERILSATPQQPLDSKMFGLDPAVGWISVVENGRPTTLLIGETTPVENNRYLKVSDRPEIFIVSAKLLEVVDQPLERFRDPLLIHVNSWLAEDLTVTSPATSFSLTRRENAWRLTSPLTDRADRDEVTSLLNALGAIRIQRVISDAPEVEQRSTWGFDHPSAELSLTSGDPKASMTVFFGNPLPDDASLVYAKRSDEPPLYAVAAADVASLLRDSQGLRAKNCFEFFIGSVTKVEILKGPATWTIERIDLPAAPPARAARSAAGGGAAQAGDQWREAGSETALDEERVGNFLRNLADLRLGGFVEEGPADLSRYGLHIPEGTIAVWSADREAPERLFIGSTIEGSTNRYGRIEGREGVVRLPEFVTELLTTTPEQLRAAAPAATPAQPTPNASE